MKERFALQKFLGAISVLLLYGAAPVPEGTELSLSAGGGQYENSACGTAHRVRHEDARIGVRHGFSDSGFSLTGEAGVSDETDTAVTQYQDRANKETDEEFQTRLENPPKLDLNHRQTGAVLGRLGYRWRWLSAEAGPILYIANGNVAPLPSLVARLQPIEQFYLYGSLLENASPVRDVAGVGLGWQGDRFRLDGSFRIVVPTLGFRLGTSVRVSDRFWLGVSGYGLDDRPDRIYNQGAGYAQLSYQFGANLKRAPDPIIEGIPPR